MTYMYVVVFTISNAYDVVLRPRSFTTNISWVRRDMTWVLVLLHILRFFHYDAPPTTFFLAATGIQTVIWNTVHCRSRAINMAACSNIRKKDLLTDGDISKGLNNEDESDVFSEESDDFWFDTSEEDSDGESDTSSVWTKTYRMKKCQIFRTLLYLTAWRVQDMHFSV